MFILKKSMFMDVFHNPGQMAPHFGPRGGGKLLSTTSPPMHVLPGLSYRPTVDTHDRIGSFQTYFIHHYRKNAVHQPLEPESDT